MVLCGLQYFISFLAIYFIEDAVVFDVFGLIVVHDGLPPSFSYYFHLFEQWVAFLYAFLLFPVFLFFWLAVEGCFVSGVAS